MLISSIIILFFLIALFNYYYDGGNQFYKSKIFEARITKLLLQNNNILICTNYDERSFQKLMLSQISIKPQIVVLGSSRSMPITHDLIHSNFFYNASISSASLEDDIAIFYMLYEFNIKPDIIIINLDPWLLYENNKLWRSSLLSEFNKGKKLMSVQQHKSNSFDKISGFVNKYSNLLLSTYFKYSIKNIKIIHDVIYHELPMDNIIINPSDSYLYKFANCTLKLPDGTQLPSKNEESMQSEAVDYISLIHVRTNQPPSLDKIHMDMFEKFVGFILKEQVRVIFYLPPYSPSAYNEFSQNSRFISISQAEAFYHAIAYHYKIRIIGSYNPAALHLTTNDFIDDLHLKNQGIKKVFMSIDNLNM